MAKRARLTELAAAKPAAPETEPPTPREPQQVKGQTLRLRMDAWRELKHLAVDEGKPTHDLIIEAVNDLLRKYGKRPIA